jgi:hypothetical protein
MTPEEKARQQINTQLTASRRRTKSTSLLHVVSPFANSPLPPAN